jgi:glycosyltransferase involved in cell wall biosynthesis
MVEALIEGLAARGHEISLVTDGDSYAARRGRELGAEVVEIPFFSLLGASRSLGVALARLLPERIHVHGSRAAFHLANAGEWASRVPCHYTVHGYHFEHRAWPRKWIGRWAERRAVKRLSSIVHVCDYDRRLAETRRLVTPDCPRRVIYNGVDVEALPAAAPVAPGRVAFVGRLVPQKDPRLIAGIAKLLAERRIPVVIVGGGAEESEVRRRLAREIGDGRVALTGEVDRERALAELAGSSVLVLPSRWEGLPVAILEALAVGVPVVAAEVGGVAEALAGGRAGLLVAGREPGAFAAAAWRVLSEADLGRRLAAAGRALVAERFSLASCLERYLRLYE